MSKFRYKKHLGQNFIHDTVKIDRMVSAMNFDKDETIIEIGPGSGNLTRKMAPHAKKIIAIELDRQAIEKLESLKIENLEIINMDFMDADLEKIIPKGKKIKIIGNIPYYITTPIIEKIINNIDKVSELYMTIQKEVADRIAAPEGSKTYGSLSVYVQYYADCEVLFKVGRKAFFPVPDVDSAFIKIDFNKKEPVIVKDAETFFKLTRGGFGQRRKMLTNNMKRVFDMSNEEAKEILEKAGIKTNARAEDVSILHFAKIADLIYNRK